MNSFWTHKSDCNQELFREHPGILTGKLGTKWNEEPSQNDPHPEVCTSVNQCPQSLKSGPDLIHYRCPRVCTIKYQLTWSTNKYLIVEVFGLISVSKQEKCIFLLEKLWFFCCICTSSGEAYGDFSYTVRHSFKLSLH